jgi:hypothetical protein
MSQNNPFARLGLVVMLGALAQGAALAETELSAEDLSQLSPQDRRAYVGRVIARQQAAPAQGGATDSTPPTLTGFNTSTVLNLVKAAASFRIAIKGTDDLSGLKSVGYEATGPSGQVISGAIDTGFPAANYQGLGGFAGGSQFLEPGIWTVTYVFGYDWAANFFNLDAAGAAALGNTTFTVSNSGGYDLVKPALASGKLITPNVSLSASAKGTASEDPLVGLKVTVTDAGNTALAGVKSASAILCQLDNPGICIYPSGFTSATGVSSLLLTLKSQVSAARGNVTGAYALRSITVMDHAGNFDTWTSTLFGGTTDFSTLFPATVITLKP